MDPSSQTDDQQPKSAGDISAAVSQLIKTSNPTVVSAVVTRLVGRETDRRADALAKAVDQISTNRRELGKIRPDNVILGADKKPLMEGYTKGKLEEQEKLTKETDKWEKAVAKALESGDYGDLFNLTGSKKE